MTTARAGWLAGIAMTVFALVGWAMDVPYVLALPPALLLAWWGFARVDLYLSTVLFLVPLSVNLSEFGLTSIGWYMPTEPMLFALLAVFVARWLSGQTPDRDFLRHPVTWVVVAGFVWMGLTVLPSSHIVVSLKAWVSRAWFIASFYVLMSAWFASDPKASQRFLVLLLVPLSVVVAYTLIRHSGYGFSKGAGHWVMKPFFKDHTSYGAVLALMLPPSSPWPGGPNKPPCRRCFGRSEPRGSSWAPCSPSPARRGSVWPRRERFGCSCSLGFA